MLRDRQRHPKRISSRLFYPLLLDGFHALQPGIDPVCFYLTNQCPSPLIATTTRRRAHRRHSRQADLPQGKLQHKHLAFPAQNRRASTTPSRPFQGWPRSQATQSRCLSWPLCGERIFFLQTRTPNAVGAPFFTQDWKGESGQTRRGPYPRDPAGVAFAWPVRTRPVAWLVCTAPYVPQSAEYQSVGRSLPRSS